MDQNIILLDENTREIASCLVPHGGHRPSGARVGSTYKSCVDIHSRRVQ